MMIFSLKILILILIFATSTSANIILSGHKDFEEVQSQRFMHTKFDLSDNGHLRATTTLRAQHIIWGFTGGIAIVLFDKRNNQVWHSLWRNYGVNLHSTRVEEWSEEVPIELVPEIKKFAIIHKHVKVDRFKENNAVFYSLTAIFP